jgi:hypothetical protein
VSNRTYDEYLHALPGGSTAEVAYTLEDVEPLRTGSKISGFIKRSNCDEIAELHRTGVICYDPEQQRGWRITYRDGLEQKRQYVIKPSKVKEIAQAIAENREYNRVRTVNARYGHVGLVYEPYGPQEGRLGRLHVFRMEIDDGIEGLLTIPDSAHRQEGDKWFAERIAGDQKQSFSPEHAGFTPDTYDLVLIITLTDKQGEGESHYEHNELITKSSSTRRAFLEGGEISPANWIVHELLRMNTTTRELVEVYENSISANSPRIITFSTLAKGVEEGWSAWISQSTKAEIARQIDSALRMAREEVPEWDILPFAKRRVERQRSLYSQAIVQRAMLRIFGEWHSANERDGTHNWERWRSLLRHLKQPYSYETYTGEFLSRENPIFLAEPGGIYQLNKAARQRKQAADKRGLAFDLDPFHDLTVQNTRLSLDYMFDQLRAFFAYEPTQLGFAISGSHAS